MNEQQIRQIAQDEMQKNYRSGQPRVAPHQHNGVDNLKIPASSVISDVTSGIVAPTSTPYRLGQIYVDTTAVKVYIATGIASSSNWTLVN